MSLALQQKLSAMFLNFSTQYEAGYQGAPDWASKVAMQITSNTRTNLIGWMDKIPSVRQWLGPRIIQNAALRNRLIENKKYELSLGVPKDDVDDDTHGLYAPMAKDMGEAFRLHPQQRIAADLILYNSLAGPVGFDDVSFFNTAHPVNIDVTGGATQSNIVTAAQSGGSLVTGYKKAKARMMGFKGADGKPMGIMGDTLLVPPALEGDGLQLFNSTFYPTYLAGSTTAGNVAAADNVWKGAGQLVVGPELDGGAGGAADTTAWLLCTSKAVRPFVHQVRQAPQFTPLFNPTDPNVAFNNEYMMLGDCRDGFDVSLWFLAVRIDLA